MRVRRSIVGIVATFGLAAVTLSGCGSPPTSSWQWAGNHLTQQLPAAGSTPTVASNPTAGNTAGSTTAPPSSTDPTDPPVPNQPGTIPPTSSVTSTSTNPPLDPNSPRANVIVGSTEHRTDGKHIALTFDDGPDPVWTPRVLALLAQYRAQATFCLIGTHARAHPQLVRAIVDAGDALCDHTMTHDEQLPSRTPRVKYDEINDAKQAILTAAPGAEIHYYRAPGGAFSRLGDPDSVQQIATDLRMQPLAWSIDTVDWTKPGVAYIVSAIESAGTHDVVLLHDAGGDRSQTLAALRVALPWLVAHGYQFDLPA